MLCPHRRVPVSLLYPLIAAGLLLTPRLAEACGGTFCNNAGPPMPVDQRGEDVLFVRDGPEIEAHVRIQYEGEAERFAWLVPLQGEPEVSVGSDPLFTALSQATAPVWWMNTRWECRDEAPDLGGVFVPSDDDLPSMEPEVIDKEVVGAFEVLTLQGGNAEGVLEFLADNDYTIEEGTGPIVQEYLDEGFLFAAVKLVTNASADEIHPLVFRFVGDEPCVPLRLTRVAAEPDMGVRAYFLDTQRWVPSNYAHVVLNPLAFPWHENPGVEGYLELLTLAVDEAGGRAFATEYAGSSDAVARDNIYRDSWDASVFVGTSALEGLQLAFDQRLFAHPLIVSLLEQFIPVPADRSPTQYYNELLRTPELIDDSSWDGAAFAVQLAERIIDPGMRALDSLEAWPYLTRLHTTISPHEMLVDPMFHRAPDLPRVDGRLVADGLQLCEEAGLEVTVPFDGGSRMVCLRDDQAAWPLRELPAALRIERLPARGPAQVTVDNRKQILVAWSDHQAAGHCRDESVGTAGGWTGPGADEHGTGSCACDSGRATPGGSARDWGRGLGLSLGLLGLALLRRPGSRRRRARARRSVA